MNQSQSQFKIEERRKQVASLLAQSLTERQIAQVLKTSQPTVNRDIQALKEASQQFVYDLAKSDLSYYYKQSIDGIEEALKQAWILYRSTTNNIETKDRLNALKKLFSLISLSYKSAKYVLYHLSATLTIGQKRLTILSSSISLVFTRNENCSTMLRY
jgi:hypothetical protein